MLDKIKWVANTCPPGDCKTSMALMTKKEAEKARDFHRSFPQYSATPLVKLTALAEKLGVKGIYVKDESKRFGLNAFKVLGGSYAIAKYIAQCMGADLSQLPYQTLKSKEIKEKTGDIIFYTATDGNHGRGVAWSANQLEQKSVVYMPAGSSPARLENIRKAGAVAVITDMNYDDTVRFAANEAKKSSNGVIVQDTAWDGYEEIPGWIMQGYGTMALEADEQLQSYGDKATHIFVQAGVGTMAAGVQGYFSNVYGDKCPLTTVVEANAADCLYQSALAREYRTVGGEMRTIMAGLACGEPNTTAWEILKNKSGFFVSVPDWVSAKGIRIAANPIGGDEHVVSGESGAVGLGLVAAAMHHGSLAKLRDSLGLNQDSVVLLFSTEGDTDPQKYQDIIWDGEYPSKE